MQRHIGRARGALAVCWLLALSAARADAPAPQPGAMTVTFLEGTASMVQPARAPQPLATGMRLAEGATVETAASSRLEVTFESGTLLRIGESTRVELREAPLEGGRFRARLWVGNLWAHVIKLVGGERFEVETQNAVAGVRGTIFRVEAAPEAAPVNPGVASAVAPDLLRLYEGAVQVDGTRAAFSHRVEPGRELRFSRQGTSGPAAFDASADAATPFMAWVHAREEAAAKSGAKSPEDKADKKERLRDRLRRLFHHE